MRLPVALILVLACLGVVQKPKHGPIQIFTHDGTFYKLDPDSKEVQWHNQLPFKLLSVDISPNLTSQSAASTILVPTIQGDFLYIENSFVTPHTKQILIPRADLEHLIDVCLDNHPDEKYFVYQKMEYFVLNSQNGQFTHLEEFLSEKSIFDRSLHSVIIVSRKLLKQMNTRMEVKWNVISSKITIASMDDFAKKGKIHQREIEHSVYSFVRVDTKTIQILDSHQNIVFEIQASSSIISIFAEDEQHNFQKISIKKREQKKILAIDQFNGTPQNAFSHEIVNAINEGKQILQEFPESVNYKGQMSQSFRTDMPQSNKLEVCLKTHKFIKETQSIENRLKLIGQKAGEMGIIPQNYSYEFVFDQDDLPTIPFSSDKRIKIIVTKEQPFVYIFLIVIIISVGIILYRLKVNKIWEQISQEKSLSDQNLKKIAAKLGEYESFGKQLKKMYEINWDKVLYRGLDYFVFEGRFLNQNAQVFVLPLKGFDTIDIQHKLNILINCSYKCVAKLYYYTRNDDSLMIFSENCRIFRKISELDQEPSKQGYLHLTKDEETYKNFIKVLLDGLDHVLDLKIELNSLNLDSILISQKSEMKLNIIPSFWHKTSEEEDKKLLERGTSRLRLNIVQIIHKLGHQGEQFNLNTFEKEKNTEDEKNTFLKDFYEHILLIQDNPENLEAIKNAEKHPFMWDSKQKMLYISDFSNYIETCIDDSKLSKMQIHCKNYQVVPVPWVKELHPSLSKQISSYRKYDYSSVRDLIRVIRNKLSHFHEIPKQTKNFIGKTPEQFVEYILLKFPKLLPFMYVYSTKKKWKLAVAP